MHCLLRAFHAPSVTVFGLGVNDHRCPKALVNYSSCLSSKNKPRTISIFRSMTEKTQNSFSHSALIGIKRMTYRWKALRKPFLMIQRSQKKKKGGELLTDYSTDFHTRVLLILRWVFLVIF